ncbi:TolC family protein [Pseudoduganella sp. FT93W]|uniref:TolC family protein n=1 Tax=Duganella fentianensis TaxID=2692177 RepID=A0A845I2D8_9BURK|nr:TolC family protein [Duganella fentianensis]MYN45871.1 TolC family protein [Duganella fentianensis]
MKGMMATLPARCRLKPAARLWQGLGLGLGLGLQLVLAGAVQASALGLLPPDAMVRQTLAELPQLRASALESDLARADQKKLAAGQYEWTLRAGHSQRNIVGGERYQEQELGLERTVRWFGKAGKDAAIGAQTVALAATQRADTWHEAGRTLLADWFEALREQVAVARWQEQLQVAQQLVAMVEKRVKAGDAARLDLLQAQAEQGRVSAQLQQARLRLEQVLGQLQLNYRGLPEPQASELPVPEFGAASIDTLQARILDDNHEVELAEAGAALAQLRAQRQDSERMPDPTLALRAVRERDGQERLLGLSISIPLGGAARSAERDAAVARAGMARERLALVQRKVAADARRAATEGVRSVAVWQTLDQVAQQAQEQAALMLRAYQAGELPLAEALTGRRLALEALLAAQSAQVDALQAEARVRLDAHEIWSIDEPKHR